ncbi:unnamed protein product [Calypogeia fissa]
MSDILETTTVGDLVAHKGRVISVPDTATITEVLSTLAVNNLTAVPVAGVSQYIGFVSVLDVVLHIADNLGQPEKEMGLLAVNIMGQSNESRTLWTLSPTTKLLEAIEPLSKGIHRFLVPSEDLAEPEAGSAPKTGLLSQTDIVRFFLQNVDYLGPVAAKTVADLGLVDTCQSPVAVPCNIPLVDVLRLMKNEGGVTAIAVVGAMDGITPGSQPRPVRGGKVLGTISASDFRGLKPDMLRSITDITVEQFLTSVSGVDTPKAPVTCRPSTPLATVMASAISSKVHRVWVTNEDGWLSGVVTFSDIISAIRQQHKVLVVN